MEPDLQDLLDEVQDFMGRLNLVRPFRWEHQELCGRIRDMRVKLDNKQTGCKSGRHRGKTEDCKC